MKPLVLLALLCAVAHADDRDSIDAQPTPIHTDDDYYGPFYVRAGVAVIDPLSTSKPMALADVDGPASLALHDGPIVGSGATVDSATVPAIIVGYRLPVLQRRLSIETVLGLPFKVKFKATGTLATDSIAPTALGIPTGVGPLGSELGEATAAPIMVSLLYRFLDHGRIRPYAGAGFAVLLA
ncbi:MAG TPA: hypothetical protein VGC41_12490, partial [Kofleriaceae bacterium]